MIMISDGKWAAGADDLLRNKDTWSHAIVLSKKKKKAMRKKTNRYSEEFLKSVMRKFEHFSSNNMYFTIFKNLLK